MGEDMAKQTVAAAAAEQQQETIENPLVHSLDEEVAVTDTGKTMRKVKKTTNGMWLKVGSAVAVIVLGVGTGYMLVGTGGGATSGSKEVSTDLPSTDGGTEQVAGKSEGIDNPSLFPDNATGELQVNDGSFTNEGTHMLIREGGPNQTVYLTSSVVDLDKYVGKTVMIKGQTNTAQKAGWLMEVGYIQVK